MRNIRLFLTAFVLYACGNGDAGKSQPKYPTLEYTDLEKLKISLPYTYTCGTPERLMVYGAYHIQDPKDFQVADIEKKIIHFNPDLILYEGDGISTAKTKNATVSEYFELGLVIYIADSLRIKTKNIEPPTKDKYRFLLEQCPKNEVMLAILGLQITMMQISGDDFEKSYPAMIKSLIQEGFPLTTEEQSLEYFYKMYRSYFKNDFSYETFDSRNIQAKYNKTSLNKINQDVNKYRDQYIIALVSKN